MARKIGKLGSNRAGTGKISADTEQSATEKWTGAVAAQVATATNVKGIITKTIPIAYIETDPDNPRKLTLTKDEITKIAQSHPMDRQAILEDDPTEWLESYIESVAASYSLSAKRLGDFESIANFAAALKSADRLLHPIVVNKDESTFHLIAGERRLLAHILLGEDNIAGRINTEQLERRAIDTLQWEENIHREEMTLWERVDRVHKIIEAGEGVEKTSVTKLSKIIGRSRAEAQRYLAILRYPSPLLLDAISSGKINDLKKAAALAQMSEDDVDQKLSGNVLPSKAKSHFKISPKANTKALSTVVTAAAEALGLEHCLASLELHKAQDLAQALDMLTAEVEASQHG